MRLCTRKISTMDLLKEECAPEEQGSAAKIHSNNGNYKLGHCDDEILETKKQKLTQNLKNEHSSTILEKERYCFLKICSI